MSKYVNELGASTIWEALKKRFINGDVAAQIVNETSKELQSAYGEYPKFEFPFSNESLTENKIVMTSVLKPK